MNDQRKEHRSNIFKVPLAMIHRHAIRLNQADGSKFYVPILTFGAGTFGAGIRHLRLSWKTSTQAKDYADRVLMRYSSLLDSEVKA